MSTETMIFFSGQIGGWLIIYSFIEYQVFMQHSKGIFGYLHACILSIFYLYQFLTQYKITTYVVKCELYLCTYIDNRIMHNQQNLPNPSEFVTNICTRIITAIQSDHILNKKKFRVYLFFRVDQRQRMYPLSIFHR